MTGLLYAEALTIHCVFPKDSFLLAVRICLSNLLAVCVFFFFCSGATAGEGEHASCAHLYLFRP